MADPIYFAPLRVPLVDQRTGLIAREWYLFLQAMWIRSGGVNAPSTDDILQNAVEGISSGDLQALQVSGDQALAQQPPVVVNTFDELLCQQLTGVKDQMAEMMKQLQDIKLAVNTGN